MSEQEEEFEAQKAERGDASEVINIPVISEELSVSDQAEDNELEQELPSGGHVTRVTEQSDQSPAGLESNTKEQLPEEVSPQQDADSPARVTEPSDQSPAGLESNAKEQLTEEVAGLESNAKEQLTEEVVSRQQDADSPAPSEKRSPTQSDSAVQSAEQDSKDYLAILDKIKAVKESLKTSMIISSARVKVVLLPVGQEIIMPFRIDTMFKYLKDHFSHLLSVPPDVLQLRCAGMILKSNETLLQHGVKPHDTVQVEIFSTLPDLYPVKRINRADDASQIITVRVQTGIRQYQQVAVEMVKSDFHKPFLGGFRHKITGLEYHNAGTQTVPTKIPVKHNIFCRDTQTVFQRKKLQQTTNVTSTQMTKIGVYVSNMTDKLVTPQKYFSAAEDHALKLAAVIVLQTYYRQWHAKIVVKNLRRQRMIRMKWEEEEKLRKIREKEEEVKLDYYRRHNPQTKEDFELLYNALESWRQDELERINESFTGAERKSALCELLEKEAQLIASIGRHRHIASRAKQEAAMQTFLNKCSASKTWRRSDGKIIEMETQFTVRARELQNIYKCIMLKDISPDERLDVLLTLKHTVKEHECKLTQEILELIDREVDLMMRGVKPENLEGLRQRIATLFFHYIKTPLFNPEAARHLKVPPDPLKLYKKVYFCYSCQQYLPSTDFAVSSTSYRMYRCRKCVSLDNETQQRESFLKYKCLLQRLYYSEANYEDDSKIAFLMQLQDIQFLTEDIWASQSALSARNDLDELVLVRWDKAVAWSPWNCILLTKDEGAAHLKLTSIEEGYEPSFIHKIRHKHILAKNYFSQIPVLASFMLDDAEVDEIRKKYHPETSPKIIESQRPCP